MRQKTIRFSGIKIRLFESPKFLTIQLNFGRYKKGRKVDTWDDTMPYLRNINPCMTKSGWIYRIRKQ